MAGFGERFRSQAACRTSRLTPEDFVGPDRLERRYEREARIARAKRVCAGCPVRLECLEWAIQRNEIGVWGGTTEDERRLMVRKATGLYLHRRDPATLTPQQRLRLKREEAAWRLYCEGMEPKEIAGEIGVSLETVKSYLRSQRIRERDEMERAQELEKSGRGQADQNQVTAHVGRAARYVDRPEDTFGAVTTVLTTGDLV